MENQENDLLEPQDSVEGADSDESETESETENSEDEERSIDLQVLLKEFALEGWSADESWLRHERPTEEGMRDYKTWQAKWAFRQCGRLAIHYRLPNDPEGVDFSSRFHARYFSLPVNKELYGQLCEQETQVALRQKRVPDIRSQKVLANEDARTFLVDRHIATLWMEGKELPPRAELTTTESIKRLQTAIRARRFRRAKREENSEAV